MNYTIHIERTSDGWWHWRLRRDKGLGSSGFRLTRWGAERAARRQIRADQEGPKIIEVKT